MKGTGSTSPEDHLAIGHAAAKRLGLFDDQRAYHIASFGSDQNGQEQLLVIGDQTIRLTPPDGLDLIEMHRKDIRAVDVLTGQGLQLHAAWKFDRPQNRWLHRVSDADATYLRELLIELSIHPPTGQGGQAIPESDWRQEQLARMVGQIVMRAAEAEHNLSLVAAFGGAPGEVDYGIFGRTGKPLRERLEEIGSSSPAVADMAERYAAWSQLRNQLVHSVRPTEEDGRPGPATHKPNRPKAGEVPGEPYTVQTQDLPDLVDMYYAFNWLYHDAIEAFLPLTTGTAVEDLPIPNSTSSDRRLPPSQHQPESGHNDSER